jgi:predicted PurR-regulated permease PerM
MTVEFLRARRERRYALIIKDPQPLASVGDISGWAARVATVGIFLLMLAAAVYLARPVLLPIVAAFVIGMTLAPVVKRLRQRGVAPWISATLFVLGLAGAAAIAVTLLSGPIIELIGKAPEMAETIKQKLYVLDWPLAALRDLQETLVPRASNTVTVEASQITLVAPVVAAITPALAQFVIFGATLLLFLISQMEIRTQTALLFSSREAKLRFLRIANDIEYNLASYVAVVSAINSCVGFVVAIGAWLFGLPNPVMFGLMTTILNFLPYIGPAVMVTIIFAVSLVTFSTLGYALLPPLAFVALATIEGQIVTPTILGRSLTLNPLLVFIAIVFWAWLWGPMGAFLAVPLSIVALVIFNHVVPSDDGKLPD